MAFAAIKAPSASWGVTGGVESGVALGPAVPGLAPRGFYAGEREGWPWHFEPATHTSPALPGWVIP